MYKKIVFCLFWMGISCVFANSADTPNIEKGQVLSSSFSALMYDSSSTENIINNIYQENFEQSTTDWSSNGDFSFEQSKISGVNVARVNHYASNANDSILSPEIMLPSINQLKEKIVLRYNESYELESSYDFGRVYVSENGSDWKLQHSVTGRNNKNTTRIDLSKYAGKSIRLKYELTSDDSYEYSGWEISNLTVDITERYSGSLGSSTSADSLVSAMEADALISENLMSTVTTEAATATDPLSAAFISLNSQNFPYIYNTINLSDPTLTQDNFTILENGVVQQNSIEVTPPESSGNTKLVDVVFIMDNSGSLSDEQLAVENNVIAFVDALNASGIDYALGLCRYGQSANYGAPMAEDAGVLTTSGTYFKNTVWQRNTVDGATEPAFDAISYSMSNFAFRPGSQKIVVLITDEYPDQGSVTDLQAKAALDNQNASLYVLTDSSLYSDYYNFGLSEESTVKFNSATTVSSNSTTTTFLNTGEMDYYKIDITVPGILELNATGTIDTYYYLYDAEGNQLNSSYSYLGTSYVLSQNVFPGTYYVGVKGYYTTDTGDYTLNSSFTGSTVTMVAPNSVTATFLNAGEMDYYKIILTNPGILSVTTDSTIDTYGYLYDVNGNQLLSNDDGGNNYNFLLSQSVMPGTYYVGARGFSTSTTGDYTLNSSFASSSLTTVAPSSSTAAFLNTGEMDYYKIDITEQGILELNVTGVTNTYYYLYDAEGNQLNYNYSYSGSSYVLSQNVFPGTYYVGVKGYSTTDTGDYTLNSSYTSIGSSIPGALYLITDPFEGVLDDISAQLSSSYLVRYQSSNPNLDGQLRTVTIQVNANGEQVEVMKSYTPGSAPIITRTAGTIAYESQAWNQNTTLSIDAIVTDSLAPFTSTVTLYYKNVGDSNYIGVTMTNSQNDIWTANIPSDIVLTPGVAYYIGATDGESAVTLPSNNAQSNPFVISILPNEAPVIANVSKKVLPGKDISVSALVTDTTNYLDEVSLYYRERGDLVYNQITMTLTAADNYEAVIPTSGITEGVEYYIYARDDFGVVTTSGTPDAPVYIDNSVNLVPIIMYLLN